MSVTIRKELNRRRRVIEVFHANLEEARQRAEARLRKKISAEEIPSVNASLARLLAQLHVKRLRHV